MLFARPTKPDDALRSQVLKRILALGEQVGTAEIEANLVPAIRRRAFYSARTPYASYLQQVRRLIENVVQPQVEVLNDGSLRARGRGESVSPARVRSDMKRMLRALGYEPEEDKRGGLQDLSSDRRINLIIETQTGMSRGYGWHRQSQARTVLDLWPADELFRALARKIPRDWASRWNEARAGLGAGTSATEARGAGGPFVALKNDPIWTAISVFGNPYPPFDYGSGMRVRDVERRRAIALGVLKPGQRVEAAEDDLAADARVDVTGMPADLAGALQRAFGPGAERIQDGGRTIVEGGA